MKLLKRFFAWRLSLGVPIYEKQIFSYKQSLLTDVRGTVVELGPGTGANFSFFPNTISWIGIEPNEYMHQYLKKKLYTLTFKKTKLYHASAEKIPIPSDSVDTVVSTLTMCSVDDISTVIHEVKRILKPNGRWYFIEHIAAETGTILEKIQMLLAPVWGVIADGCNPHNRFLHNIGEAGFRQKNIRKQTIAVPVISPHLIGYVVK